MSKKATVTITSRAANKELRIEDCVDFWIVPAYSNAEILVKDEDGNTLYGSEDFTIEQVQGLLSYSDALDDPEDKANHETLAWFRNAKFKTAECFRKVWKKFVDENLDEVGFCIQLIRDAVGDELCETEVELSVSEHSHQPLVATYEVDLTDGEFDESKIDFIGFDLEDDSLSDETGCAEILSHGFGGGDCVLMNIMRYGDTFYQTCGDDDGFIAGCEIIEEANVNFGEPNMPEV